MSLLLTLAFLFFIGSVLGWVLELLFRNLTQHPEKLVNPGFCPSTASACAPCTCWHPWKNSA